MQILSYVLSILGLISLILTTLAKGEKMKSILFLLFCVKIFENFSKFMLGGLFYRGTLWNFTIFAIAFTKPHALRGRSTPSAVAGGRPCGGQNARP